LGLLDQARTHHKIEFSSDNWHCPIAENDLQIGGKIKSRMEAADGGFGYDFEAI
jgi:uncharacterized protein YndB with AHSA1/START domain